MAEKVTFMLLRVDLQCPCCYKKIKKILCKIPQIRDQVYDEKQNLVKITVVCCSPHKILDKLRCMGDKVITSIEIVELPLQKPPPKKPEKKPEKREEPEKKPEKREEPEKKPENRVIVVEKHEDPPKPIPVPPGAYPVPFGFCCVQCFDGYGGGPCYHYHYGYGYGRPVPPPPAPCYENYGYGYSYGKGCYVSRCDYFSEENASACNIM